MIKNLDYTIACPICGTQMAVAAKRFHDGWHDAARCCERTWDICCQNEFRQTYSHTRSVRLMPRAIGRTR